MGVIESRQIKSAISSDGLQNVKKAAFIQYSIENLKRQKTSMKQNFEAFLEQKLSHKIQFIQQQKELCSGLFNDRVNQISLKDPDFIDRLQSKMRKSFKQITGYKKAIENLEKIKNKTIKSWNQEGVTVLEEIQVQLQKVEQKLLKETPQTTALNKLDPSAKQKVFAKYIQDQSYEIQKDGYMNRAIEQLQKVLNLDSIVEERFEKKIKTEEVTKIVDELRQNIEGRQFNVDGCGFGC